MKIKIIILFFLIGTSYATINVPVFYPYTNTASQLQKSINNKLNLKRYRIEIFSRFEDFNQIIRSGNIDFAMSPSCFDLVKSSFIPLGRKTNAGKKFHNLTFYREKSQKVQGKKKFNIGLLQTCPISKNYQYVKSLSNLKIKRVKSVPNAEEIMNLLIFEMVDYIAITTEQKNSIQKESDIKLIKVTKSKNISNFTIYKRKGSKTVTKSFKPIALKIIKKLGGEGISWIN